MELERIDGRFSVCRIQTLNDADLGDDLYFIGKTDEEISLVCRTRSVPKETLAREDGWRALRVCGILDFSLTGILSRISSALSDAGIGLFAVSTYNTDYILIKEADFEKAVSVLDSAGCRVI